MPLGNVQPAGQPAPDPDEQSEYATVKILTARLADGGFARMYANETYPHWLGTAEYKAGEKVTYEADYYICTLDVTGGGPPVTDPVHWAPTTAPTKVIERIEAIYTVSASLQFYCHSGPNPGTGNATGVFPGAFEKASRIEAILALSSNIELMDSLGLGLVNVGTPTNVGALVSDPVWNDRGSVDLTFTVSDVETNLVESIATVEFDLSFQNQVGIDHKTIKVQP
jgi:hypothetical protein